MRWRDYVTVDPAVCRGKTCMKSTHSMVSLVLKHLATGLTPVDIVRSHPSLVQEPVQAAIAYAAGDLVQDGLGEPAARGRTVRMADGEWRYRPSE